MATRNLVNKSLGKIEYGSGNGIPDHIAIRGSFYIDVDTDKIYINNDGTSTGWVAVLKPQRSEIYLQSNTSISQTATSSWLGIQGNATSSIFSSSTFTLGPDIVLISATGDGGFESSVIQGTAGFAANGWTVNNGTQTSKWFVGTTGASGSGYGAYISINNGATNTYNAVAGTTTSTVYFYRDVIVPEYVTDLTLSFSIRVGGESSFDYLNVYNSTNATPFSAGTPYSNQIGQYLLLTGYPTRTIQITLTASSATQSRRIAFGWRNDNTGGQEPPASIDNISLTAKAPIYVTYTGSQSTFRTLLTGSLQSTAPITNIGVQITKNGSTSSNPSETSINLGSNYKDSFSTQNVFTMSNGDVVRPFLNNKVSNLSVLCPNLFLGIWEID